MDRGEPSLKPEWLVRGASTTVAATNTRPATSSRADDQGRATTSRNRSLDRDRERSSQQSSSRRGAGSNGSRRHGGDGTGKSRGFASFRRSCSDRGREKISDFRDRDIKLGLPDDPLHEGFESFSSCRPERDRLDRTRSKLDTWNRSTGISLDNGKKDAPGGISFEREFPHLGSEDKSGKQDIVRVPSPGISTPIQSIPRVTAPDGWSSVLAEVPMLSEPSNSTAISSLSRDGSSKQLEVSICGTALSMAETVMQAPLKISTAPQISIDAQNIEERTMRQCILRPLTPSSRNISVLSSSDKFKTKAARAGDFNGPIKVAPQLSILPGSISIRTQVRTELVKLSQPGSFKVLSRDQNGIASTTTDCNSNPVSPVLGRSSSVELLKKHSINQKFRGATNGLSLHLPNGSSVERKANTKDRRKFFEFIRSKSLNGSCIGMESSDSLTDDHQNPCFDLSSEKGSGSCEEELEEENSSGRPQQHLSDKVDLKPPLEPDVSDNRSHVILPDANPSSELADTEDVLSKKHHTDKASELADTEDVVSKKHHTDKASAVVSTIHADIDSSARSSSSDEEANVPLGPIGSGEEEPYPAQEKPSPEDLAFLLSCGWNEHEEVPPLQQEEIVDCLRRNERLQQKLQECRG